jgi:hypothetical protein
MDRWRRRRTFSRLGQSAVQGLADRNASAENGMTCAIAKANNRPFVKSLGNVHRRSPRFRKSLFDFHFRAGRMET